jgi:hypothetical protein
MQRETKARVGIAAVVYTMTNAVLFGAGLIIVLLLPGFSDLKIWIPVVVVASIILAAFGLDDRSSPTCPLLAATGSTPSSVEHPHSH